MINRPSNEAAAPNRARECQDQLEVPVARLIDNAVNQGWAGAEVFDALEEVVANLRLAYFNDQTPANGAETIVDEDLDGATANL